MSSKKNIRYKCPFCDKRMNREDLVIHVTDEHEDLVPEDFTPFRYVFNYVNKKPLNYHGKCTECGGPTPWDENKGRYNRQCEKASCKASFIKKFEANMVRTKGVTRISSTVEGQEKMLANRKISGKYKFKNGVEKTYTGSYELKALQFMDQVMDISPDDILCPGPILEYEYKGTKHLYITDFYYQPYNLIIEVKDGGSRPNKRDMPDYRGKQIAKEEFIIKHTNYNYLRLTDNDLSQLLAVFADLKMQMVENTGERVIHVNESVDIINEGLIKNEPDIYYNKDKFDSKEINLCFITGHSGSGKSTMAGDIADKEKIEQIQLDDIIFQFGFTDDNLKEYNNLVYSFFKGPGKKYRKSKEELIKNENYEEEIISDFIKYAHQYAKSHKTERYIIEGIQLYLFVDKKDLKEDAVYIKGTSSLISMFRAAKRDWKLNASDKTGYDESLLKKGKWLITRVCADIKYSRYFEKRIKEYRDYFSDLASKSINEAMNALMTGYIPGMKDSGSVYIVNYMKNNVFSGEQEQGYGISDNCKLTNLICRNKEGVLSKAPDNFLEDADYNVYLLDMKKEDVSNKLAPYMNTFVEEGFVYETIFGKKMYTYDQIETESTVYPVIDYYKGMDTFAKIVESYLKYDGNKDGFVISNENSSMSFDIDNSNEDLSCVSYCSIKDGTYHLESVEFPHLSIKSNEFIGKNSVERKVLEGLLIGGVKIE